MTLYPGSPCCNDLLLSEDVTPHRFGSNSDQMAYTVELVGVRAPPLPDTLCGLQLHLSHVMTSDMDFATQDTQRVLAGTCVTIVANAIPYARMSILPPATATATEVLVVFTAVNPIPADGWVTPHPNSNPNPNPDPDPDPDPDPNPDPNPNPTPSQVSRLRCHAEGMDAERRAHSLWWANPSPYPQPATLNPEP